MFTVLRIRDYRLMASGQLLSNLGDWLMLVAAPYYVLRLTGSTLATGLSLGAETVPAILLGPVAGVLADRWDRRRTALAADLLRAASVSLMLLAHRPGEVWLIYVALICESSFSQFFNPTFQALLPAVVGRGPELSAANSVGALIGGTVRLVGGPLGGALYALVGFAPVVAMDAGSYLASAVLITAMRFRPEAVSMETVSTEAETMGSVTIEPVTAAPVTVAPVTMEPATTTPWRRFAEQLRDGMAHVRTTPGLPGMFTAAAIFLVGNGALTALLIPYTRFVLHAATGTLGLLFGALGVGYLVGAPVSRFAAARLGDRTTMAVGLAGLGAVFAVAFNVRDTAWVLVLFTLIGPPAVCFLTTASTYLTRHTPDYLLGRANSAYGMVQAGATLIGMVAGAVLGQQFGIHLIVNLAAVTIALGGVAVLGMPSPQAGRWPAGH